MRKARNNPTKFTNDTEKKNGGHARASTSLSVALARGESDDISRVEHFSKTTVVCDESRDDA